MIRLSVGTTKQFKAISINKNNKQLETKVDKHKFDINRRNLDVLELVYEGVCLLNSTLQKNGIKPEPEEYVVIEFKNKHVLKWMQELKVPEQHSDLLIKMFAALDKLPYRVKYIYVDKPTSEYLATESEYNKRKETFSTSIEEFMTLED